MAEESGGDDVGGEGAARPKPPRVLLRVLAGVALAGALFRALGGLGVRTVGSPLAAAPLAWAAAGGDPNPAAGSFQAGRRLALARPPAPAVPLGSPLQPPV